MGSQSTPKRVSFRLRNHTIFRLFLESFVEPFFLCFLDHFRDWSSLGDQIGPKEAKMDPMKSFKVPKTCMCKDLNKAFSFLSFVGVPGRPRIPLKAQETLQEALESLLNFEKTKTKNGKELQSDPEKSESTPEMGPGGRQRQDPKRSSERLPEPTARDCNPAIRQSPKVM